MYLYINQLLVGEPVQICFFPILERSLVWDPDLLIVVEENLQCSVFFLAFAFGTQSHFSQRL